MLCTGFHAATVHVLVGSRKRPVQNDVARNGRGPYNRGMKLALLWILFALAVLGTYALSQNIQARGDNYAAVFMANGSKHEVMVYADRAEPKSIEANKGDEIIFTVADQSRHNIAEERSDRDDARLESGEIGYKDSYSLVFQRDGSYSLYDRLNQDIRVTVTIQ